MTVTLTENRTVQTPIMMYSQAIGWEYISPEDALAMRLGNDGYVLEETLKHQLILLNPILPEDAIEEVIRNVENVNNSVEGNKTILEWLRGEKSVFVEREKRQIDVTVIDFEHPANNTFQVTDEWELSNGRFTNRADIMFLINGIPVALVETKRASKKDAIADGFTQIRRYHKETPELMVAPQVFDLTDLLKFFYGATWNTDRKNLFNWNDETNADNFEQKVKQFFNHERFLRLLKEWIVFFQKDDELQKIVLRQHQTRAVDKVVARAADPTKHRGLVWHTQGSGKTISMIKIAELVQRHPALNNPTIILLVDRNELEGQLSGWLERVLGENVTTVVQSKAHLRQLLKAQHRGVILSMIHKFDKADKDMSTRENIIVLVDEAHRTTGGDLGNFLVGALPNATLIGFTGTPIDKTQYGKGTFKTFGTDDPDGYTDKYSISQSIHDGTTLPLRYTLAPNDVRVPKEQLEKEFFALTKSEGVSDIEDLNDILEDAVQLRTFLKAHDRVKQVSEFIVRHFKENVDPLGYKAFVVGVDRDACQLYKEALDKLLPPSWSQVVYSTKHNDVEAISKHRLSDEEEKKIRKDFAKPDALPKILIVTEKLLTGYDAPILYCMYLDKPMRDHVLLQTIARVNRPYEEDGDKRKPSGLVIDFVGIFENLEKALAFDSDVVQSVIENLDIIREQFAILMTNKATMYLQLMKGKADDKMVENIIVKFTEKEERQAFYEVFKNIEMFYEILSPDAFLRDYLDDYQKLAEMYQLVRKEFALKEGTDRDLLKKTEQLVMKNVTAVGVSSTRPIVDIDEEALAALKASNQPDEVKVHNLIKSIQVAVEEEASKKPFLLSIGERAEEVADGYEDRQIETERALRKLLELTEERLVAEREFNELGLGGQAFVVYWMLKKQNLMVDHKDLAVHIYEASQKYPNWQGAESEQRNVRIELTELFRKAGVKPDQYVGLIDKIFATWERTSDERN